MEFKQLDQDYQDDVLAEALYSREHEWFHYDFDRGNYQRMAEALLPGPEREDLLRRIRETQTQMDFVESIYDALSARVVNAERHARAVERVTKKRLEK